MTKFTSYFESVAFRLRLVGVGMFFGANIQHYNLNHEPSLWPIWWALGVMSAGILLELMIWLLKRRNAVGASRNAG